MPKIGAHIKRLRLRRRLSVRDLAKRSGIAHATISLIERDRTSPSIDTLAAILDSLGTTLDSFFTSGHTTRPVSPFYQHDDFVEIGDKNKLSYRMIGVNHPNRSILMLYEVYEVGADSGLALSHEAQEAGVVVQGEVEVTVGEQRQVLGAGDGYYFDSNEPHTFRNVGKTKAIIISAVTPPSY
jgi:transcriptional regulator with XRE-family HTH domain